MRAAGPGLLVIGEGYDAGFGARVDGAPARVLRVNGDRIGVVLQEGTHRIVLTHRARGFLAGLVIAALAALRPRRSRRCERRGARFDPRRSARASVLRFGRARVS